MNSIEDLLQSANAAMRAGQLSLAEQQFREILSQHANQPDALHRLGLIAIQTGRHGIGLQLLQSAVAGPQPNPDYLADLGDACRLMNRFAESAEACRRALAIAPNHSNALNNLGATLLDQNRPQEAIPYFQQAVQANPNLMQAQYNLGRTLLEISKPAEALPHLERATQLAPNLAAAYRKLAQTLLLLKKPQFALATAQRAVSLDPANADGYFLKGSALGDLDEWRRAAPEFQRTVELNPLHPQAWSNLGVSRMESLQLPESRECFEEAIRLNPNLPDPHFHRSLLMLAAGDFLQGWKEYEWRWQAPNLLTPKPRFSQPLWDGRPLPNSTILIHCEQGFGDCIQFARYVPLVAQRVGRVILDCYPSLLPLFSSIEGVHEVVCRGLKLPDFDVHCPLLSLPSAFETTPETIPSTIPYLRAPAQSLKHWTERLSDDKNFRIGVVWAAGTLSTGGSRRSLPLGMLAGLANIGGVTFYGLQKGHAADELKGGGAPVPVIDLSDHLTDFGQTAAIIKNMDLVISVDTGVAHLAGALGKSVLILLAHRLDWRWPVLKPRSPWYPSAKLFWASETQDWSKAIADVRQEIIKRCANTGHPDDRHNL